MENIDNRDSHIAIVLAPDLAFGIAANCTANLMSGLAATHPEILGPPLRDAEGHEFPGIAKVPSAILLAKNLRLEDIYLRCAAEGVFAVVFFAEALRLRSYMEYISIVAGKPLAGLTILGVGMFGKRDKVRKISGSLPLA